MRGSSLTEPKNQRGEKVEKIHPGAFLFNLSQESLVLAKFWYEWGCLARSETSPASPQGAQHQQLSNWELEEELIEATNLIFENFDAIFKPNPCHFENEIVADYFWGLLKCNKCITYLTGDHMLIHLCCDYDPKQKSQFMLQRQNFPVLLHLPKAELCSWQPPDCFPNALTLMVLRAWLALI